MHSLLYDKPFWNAFGVKLGFPFPAPLCCGNLDVGTLEYRDEDTCRKVYQFLCISSEEPRTLVRVSGSPFPLSAYLRGLKSQVNWPYVFTAVLLKKRGMDKSTNIMYHNFSDGRLCKSLLPAGNPFRAKTRKVVFDFKLINQITAPFPSMQSYEI